MLSPADIAARFPWITFFLILLFISGPEWVANIWSLFSNDPVAYKLAVWLNMSPPEWSPYWIIVPLGILMCCYLAYVLRRRDGQQVNHVDRVFPRAIERFISDPNARTKALFILLAGLAVWLLTINVKMSALRDDIDCFVIPRSLTEDQILGIGEFLAKYDPHEIVVASVKYDVEAGNYSGDFRRAFEKGGWTVTGVSGIPEDAHQEGLALDFNQPLENANQKADPKHPRANELVNQAFKLTHVQIEGNSSGGGVGITQTVLTLRVGHRRRDGYACEKVRKKVRQEQLLKRLSDP